MSQEPETNELDPVQKLKEVEASLETMWKDRLPLTPERLAGALDVYLETIEETEGLAECVAPVVITFALATLGLAKTRTLILTAQEAQLSDGENNTHLLINRHTNYPGSEDAPEFCDQLELGFADFLYKRNAPTETATL